MLGQAPVVGAGLDVDGEVDDLDRAVEPGHVAGDVRHGQVGLDGVHGGVDAAVVLRVGEVRRVGLDGHVEGLVPPPALLRRHGVAQKLVGAGAVGGRRRGRGQQDEGVLVALLAGLRVDGRAAALGVQLVAHRRVPAAVLVVPHRPAQGPHAVVGEAAAAGNAHEGAQREGEGHPPGDPQLDGVGGVHRAVLADPPEAGGNLRGARIAQERVRLGRQPAIVLGSPEPSQSHESSLTRVEGSGTTSCAPSRRDERYRRGAAGTRAGSPVLGRGLTRSWARPPRRWPGPRPGWSRPGPTSSAPPT